jgi:hypothetical protein
MHTITISYRMVTVMLIQVLPPYTEQLLDGTRGTWLVRAQKITATPYLHRRRYGQQVPTLRLSRAYLLLLS